MCQCTGHTHSAYIQYKQQQHNSWEARLPSDTLSNSSAHGQQTLRSAGRDNLPSASVWPARKGTAVPQCAALPQRQKPSAQGKLDFTSLCLGVCFRKLHIPEQSFRIYPNCSVRCRTEPSRYVCLGWCKAFLSLPFLLFSEYISESTWKYFIFVDDLRFRGSTWTKVLTFFLTFDWSYEKKEHLVNITYL